MTNTRVARLLNLVPYLVARPEGVPISELADDFGVPVVQIRADLTLLWMCGLPGYGPGDLIDIAFDADTVRVIFAAGMDRPVRLAGHEALALSVALRVLADTPGVGDRAAIASALDKLAAAAGVEATEVPVRDTVAEADVERYAALVESGNAARITYYSASRDTTSERIIDPIEVVAAEGHAYLRAWCRSAEEVRQFRLDRIDACTVIDEPAASSAGLASRGPAGAADSAEPAPTAFLEAELPRIELRVGPGAKSITDSYPCEEVVGEADGHRRVTMRVRDLDWARRLVLGLGGEAQVIAPAELRESVKDSARAALARYADAARLSQ
ncbi:WYL domain-containing protein [Glycomyces sp. L485]|uniref:helix-turn-helix transcriptional regulator n=1 Tax=Glycomyces sp. L485 TaxID=2909235 RepID=UPI001F4A81C9|nr:WYL domain-containing protein [Glycomyces sp. L485]MCH7231539.1 WYL domain-containing protein [Glycomyces sp. L485]